MRKFKSGVCRRVFVASFRSMAVLLILFGLGCGDNGRDNESVTEQGLKPQALVPPSLSETTDRDTTMAEPIQVTEPETISSDEPGTSPTFTGQRSLADTKPAVTSQSPFQPGGLYSLQLGSFGKATGAERRAQALRELGHDPVIEIASLDGQVMHRVFLRGLADRAAAETLGQQLNSELGITYLILRRDG